MKKRILACLLALLPFFPAAQGIDPAGSTIVERFAPPAGFVRAEYSAGSFQAYVKALPLKKHGSPVMLFDGRKKANAVHAAVFDIPLLKEDLLQCADMIMKIRAEYLYSKKSYKDIVFTISNGMLVPFSKFADGYRIAVAGNRTSWKKGYKEGHSRENFDAWLRFIYAYAGTLSLAGDLAPVPLADISVGDVFIAGGSPGHAVMVLDLARDAAGRKAMLLGQSYMPSQEFHVLKSFNAMSPWYPVEDGILETPEWVFPENSLRRFASGTVR